MNFQRLVTCVFWEFVSCDGQHAGGAWCMVGFFTSRKICIFRKMELFCDGTFIAQISVKGVSCNTLVGDNASVTAVSEGTKCILGYFCCARSLSCEGKTYSACI